MTVQLEEMIEHVKELSPDELRQLRDAVDDLLAETQQQQSNEDELERRLVGLGVLDRAIASIVDAPIDANFRPVGVQGAPVSATIIEERR